MLHRTAEGIRLTEYLDGYGKQAIANTLFEEGVPTCLGGEWSATTVGSILRNEKYAGDLLLQKTYVADHITKVCKKNNGDLPQYFIQDDHEAIVSRGVFNAVQAEMARRAERYTRPRGEFSELTSLVPSSALRTNMVAGSH